MGMRLSLVMVRGDELETLSRDPQALVRLLLHSGADIRLEMDKEWHGINFLLTGEPWPVDNPLSMVIFGADDIGDNLGYGPARTLNVAQVHQVANILLHKSAEDLRGRYDVATMTAAMIYPEVWQREGAAGLDWLLAGYQRLVKFYTQASTQGYAVVLAIL